MTLLPGAECSQLLSLEKVTWLRSLLPALLPADNRPLTTVASTHPPHPLLSSQRSFSPAPIRLAQWGAVNSLRSANFQDGMPTPLSGACSGTAASTSRLKRENCWGVGVAPQNILFQVVSRRRLAHLLTARFGE